MSRFEGWLTTNTRRSLDEVFSWLISLSNWTGERSSDNTGHRRIAKSVDGAVVAIVIDSGNHRPGSAASSTERLGTPKTIMFDFFIRRNQPIRQLDQMYDAAFKFCMWDDACNAIFTLDDDNFGVFLRRDGQYLVNLEEFASQSLAGFLTFPYQVPDAPGAMLCKIGWPNDESRVW